MKFLSLLVLVSQMASAQETWFCSEESAKRNGNVISVCGVGESMNDEGYARKRALSNALEEFRTLCDLSSDCSGQPMSVEPKRTTCSIKANGIVKCYRMIEITVGK